MEIWLVVCSRGGEAGCGVQASLGTTGGCDGVYLKEKEVREDGFGGAGGRGGAPKVGAPGRRTCLFLDSPPRRDLFGGKTANSSVTLFSAEVVPGCADKFNKE